MIIWIIRGDTGIGRRSWNRFEIALSQIVVKHRYEKSITNAPDPYFIIGDSSGSGGVYDVMIGEPDLKMWKNIGSIIATPVGPSENEITINFPRDF